MYCKHCGKEIADDSKFCRYCGTNLVDVSLASNHVESNEVKTDPTISDCGSINEPIIEGTIKNSEQASKTEVILKEKLQVIKYRPFPLVRRFIGSLIDKIIILIIAVVGYIACKPYAGAGDIGSFMGLMNTNPSNYEYIDKIRIDSYGNIYEGVSIEYQMRAREESEIPYIGYTRDLEIKMCFIFIMVNIFYYIFFEFMIRASLGKNFLGGELVDEGREKLSYWRILLRSLVFFAITAVVFCVFRYLVKANYYIIIAVFFLFMDLPLLINKRSLLDICTRTMYIDTIKKEDFVDKYGKPDIKKSLKE